MKKKRDPRDIDVYPKKREPKRPKQGWSYNITKFVKNEIMYPHRRKYRKRRVH